MKIYLATWLFEPEQGNALTARGANQRLLSYHHTKGKEEELVRYVKEGTNEKD